MDEAWGSLGIILMGLGGVAAGVAGVSFPEGRRLAAVLSLIAGAGVGIVVLGVATFLDPAHEPSGLAFFVGSLLGFLTVCSALWFARAAARRPERP
jgi:hypothetical protein